MNRVPLIALVVLLAGVVCSGQTASSGTAPSQAATPKVTGHGAFAVKVGKTLDSGKLKEGDTVEVEIAEPFKLADGTLVSKGTKLTGHVATSKARAKGDAESELTVVFDKLNLANGKQLMVKGSVQAVLPPPDYSNPTVAVSTMSKSGGPGYQPSDIKSGSNLEVTNNAPSLMDPKAVGVHGMHGLELKDGVLSSKGKNVKLGGDMRMIVHIDIFGSPV
jgi:hypothetical protein